jgi:hypothetical protein
VVSEEYGVRPNGNTNITKYDQSRKWSNKFNPAIKRLCGEHLISETSLYEDRNSATDLEMPHSGISVRVRKFADRKYDGEFTIRSARDSGAVTELAKVLAGYGDVIFYGFADESERGLSSWFLGDLAVFRRWYFDRLEDKPEALPGKSRNNGDGTSFTVFSLAELPPQFIIARRVYSSARH